MKRTLQLKPAGMTFVMMLPVLPTAAQDLKQQVDWCNGKDKASDDLRISGCTAAIQSGKFTPANLAKAFNQRGSVYRYKKQYDLAIQDFDQATRLNPNFVDVFDERGTVYLELRKFEKAIDEFSAALTKD